MTSGLDIAPVQARTARAVRTCALGALVLSAAVSYPYRAGAQTPTPIAAIQENVPPMGTEVTVEGQVYIPTNYRGATISGYIQDSSGRGINLFGSTADNVNLRTIGNRVRITGEIGVFNVTTIEILNITAITLLGSGSRDVPPVRVGTGEAARSRWEGTFIETRGTVSAISMSGGATNYTINDGTGVLIVRVINILGAPSFAVGQSILARGAGSKFNADFQILVGTATDIGLDPGGADTTPPVLAGAWANSGTTVRATFNEVVNATSGAVAANYVVRDLMMSTDIAISSATVSGPVVNLVLASSLRDLAAYELRATSVADLAGNPIVTPTTVGFTNTNVADTTPPTLVSASAPSLSSVAVVFSEPVAAASGGTATNYEVFVTSTPATTVPVSGASVSGATVTLTLGGMLTASTNYTVRVQNVADLAGNPMVGMQTASFTAAGGPTVTPIATIQANPQAFVGMSVTVQGQVYMPANYRGTTTYSGYIQDGSGRGINLFGSSANNPLLFDRGNIVRVTGTVAIFSNTTVELTPLTDVTLVSSGNPPLTPAVLTTGAAASAQWEGTFIETVGTISATASTGGSSPAVNYTVNDGSGDVVIRVLDSFNVAQFNVGERIRGRGAGSQFSPDFQILVGRGSDVFVDTGGPDTTPPTVTNATAPTATSVSVTFSEAVTSASGGSSANYTVFETANTSAIVPVSSATLAGDRRSATLALGASLVDARSYTVRVTNLQDDAGNTQTTPQTRSFSRGGGPTITPIAAIQASPTSFEGMMVTVEGQVYIPSNYRGTTISGYIQDGSGRGINLFGSTANVPALQNTGNIVRLTGTVTIFNTIIEITGLSGITVLSSGNPPLTPAVLRTRDAANRQWEGTYILTSGSILAKTSSGGAFNYTVDDGSGPVVVRVVNTINATEFNVGQTITARGAGSQFGNDFQILVGEAAAVFEGLPMDVFPPSVVRASATGAREVTVTFNEAVGTSGGEVSNYEVFRTNLPSETIGVIGATVGGASVRLALAGNLDVSRGYTVRVRNVADLLGNAISAAGVTRVIEEALAETVTLSGPPFTFLPRRGESYPITFTVPSDVAGDGGEVLLRIFDLQGRLVRMLFDSRFDTGAFTNNRAVRAWDGRDDVGQIVPAGTYVAHLHVVGNRSGEAKKTTIPVVVATRLDR